MDQTLPDDRPVAVRDMRMRRSTLPLPLSWRLAVFAASAWHALRAALSTAVAAATLAILFAPAIVFAVAGCWAVFTFANTLYTVWHLLENWQLAGVFALRAARHPRCRRPCRRGQRRILRALLRAGRLVCGAARTTRAAPVLAAGPVVRHPQHGALRHGRSSHRRRARSPVGLLRPAALCPDAVRASRRDCAGCLPHRPATAPAPAHGASAPLAVVRFGPSAPLDAVYTEVESVPESVSDEAAPLAPPANSVPFVVSKAPTEAPFPEDSIVSAPSADAGGAAPSEDTDESASPAAPAPPPEAVAPLDIPEPRAAPAAAHETTPPAESTDEGATRPELVTLRNG